jgi:hypothetical protein
VSEFQSVSLRIAQGMLNVSWWQMWAAIATVLVAASAAWIGIRTLRQLVDQVKLAAEANAIGQLNALLVLEQDMSRRRDRLGEIATQLEHLQKSAAYNADPSILDPVIRQFNEGRENYLNSLDRLCFCVLRNKFSDDELRSDYRDVVKQAIVDSPEQFGAASSFRNILKLHNKWADS